MKTENETFILAHEAERNGLLIRAETAIARADKNQQAIDELVRIIENHWTGHAWDALTSDAQEEVVLALTLAKAKP